MSDFNVIKKSAVYIFLGYSFILSSAFTLNFKGSVANR